MIIILRKTSIIAPVGTSPPVITEFLQYIADIKEIHVNDVTMITTKEDMVIKSSIIADLAINDRYPNIKIHTIKLPFSDINSFECAMEFLKISVNILKDQQRKYNVDSTFICIAGGRKWMSVMLSIISQFLDVDGVYYVVSPDVGYLNLDLERIRRELDILCESKDKQSYYKSNKKIFNKLLFPEPSSYSVIPIPIFPVEKKYLYKIKTFLSSPNDKNSNLDYYLLTRLSNMGLIKMDKNKIHINDEGRKMLEIVMEVLE